MEGWCLWITTTALLLHWRCMGVSIWWIWMLFSAAQGRRHHWAGARFVFCLFCSIIRNQDFKASFLFNKPGLPLAYKLTHLTHYYSKPHSLSPSQSMFISVPIAHTDILHLFFFFTQKNTSFFITYTIVIRHVMQLLSHINCPTLSHETLFSFACACHPASHARRLIGTSWQEFSGTSGIHTLENLDIFNLTYLHLLVVLINSFSFSPLSG